jgi:hypothetical protein
MADMKMNFPTYSGVSQAYDYLRANNIHAQIIRTPAKINRSCGYSLRVNDADSAAARRMMSAYGINNNIFY